MALSNALAWLDPAAGETTQYINATDVKNAITQIYTDMSAAITALNANEVTIQPDTPPTGTEIWIDTDDQYYSSASSTRQVTSMNTATIPSNVSEMSTIPLASGYRLYAISTSSPARVRLYTTVAKQEADLSRAIGVVPTGDHGLMFEYRSTYALLEQELTPTVDGFDGEAVPDGMIPITVTNIGGAANSIIVSLTWIKEE